MDLRGERLARDNGCGPCPVFYIFAPCGESREPSASASEIKLSLFPEIGHVLFLLRRAALEEIELLEPKVASAVEKRERAVAEFEGDCGAGLRVLAELGLLAGEEKVAFMLPAESRRGS